MRASDRPPATLGIPPPVSTGALGLIGVLLLILSGGAAAALTVLWTAGSSGWWFNTIFTAMAGVIIAGGWAAYLDCLKTIAERVDAKRRWALVGPSATPIRGTVTARDVSLTETGSVSHFRLALATEIGTLSAAWHATPTHPEHVLQPQIPGVGSSVRVWHAGPGEPFVVEVKDPTVISH